MKAMSLLLLRVSTGLYLVLWGLVKLVNKETAASVSDKYYSGLLTADTINYAVGAIEVAVGVLVILGLLRSISYLGQLVFYVIGIIPIITHILDPFGMYLRENSVLVFFPSTTLLFASLVIIAFREYDTLSLDAKRGK